MATNTNAPLAAARNAHARAVREFYRCLNARDAGFYDESSPRLIRARERLRATWAVLHGLRADADIRAITGAAPTDADRAILAEILADEVEGSAT